MDGYELHDLFLQESRNITSVLETTKDITLGVDGLTVQLGLSMFTAYDRMSAIRDAAQVLYPEASYLPIMNNAITKLHPVVEHARSRWIASMDSTGEKLREYFQK